MQKVVYSVTKVNKDEKLKGVGYLVEGNLLIPSTSSKGNAYIRVFEDVAEKCRKTKIWNFRFFWSTTNIGSDWNSIVSAAL